MVRRHRERTTMARPWGAAAAVALALAVAGFGPGHAQEVTNRLTGAKVLENVHAAAQAIDERAKALSDASLVDVSKRLSQMEQSLQKELGDKAAQPLAIIDAQARSDATRANAAAERVQAWLKIADGCNAGETAATAAALALMVDRLASDTASQKAPLPIVNGIETVADHRPLFVLQPGDQAPKFVLTGENLVDPQCANPVVSAFDAQGRPVPSQPKVSAAEASRVELVWPGADKLATGGYVLRLASKRKAFLFGCVDQPPASAALQVAGPMRYSVSYTLSARCPGAAADTELDKGTLPDITARNQTVSHAVSKMACADPVSYTVTAQVGTAGGQPAQAGPVTQPADASITLGMKNGLSLNWDPSVRQLVVRAGAAACKGIY